MRQFVNRPIDWVSSFPNSVWERKIAKLCLAAAPAKRSFEKPRSQTEFGNEKPKRPVGWFVLLVVGVPAVLVLVGPTAGQVPAKLPEVEPLTHKNYTEKISDSDVSFEMI